MIRKPKTYKEAYVELRQKNNDLLSEIDKLKKKRKHEFSKIILLLVMLTYYIGFGYGLHVVEKILTQHPEYAIQAFIAILSYVAAPVGVAIGFYSWKAKNDNAVKMPLLIAQDNEEEKD